MRIPSATVGTFGRLDSTVTVADAFCDAYVRSMARNNHNALLARRARRNILHMVYGNEDGPTSWWDVYGIRPPHEAWGPFMLRTQIMVTQQTQKLKLYVRACKNTASASHPLILAQVHDPDHSRAAAGATITVSAAPGAPTDYAVDLPVPLPDMARQYFRGFLSYTLTLIVQPVIDPEPPTYSGMAVTDHDDNWVVAAIPLATIGSIIACDSDRTIEPRQIVRIDTGGRRWVDSQWNKEFRVGTDTIEVLSVIRPTIFSVSLYEQNVTGFYDTPGAV